MLARALERCWKEKQLASNNHHSTAPTNTTDTQLNGSLPLTSARPKQMRALSVHGHQKGYPDWLPPYLPRKVPCMYTNAIVHYEPTTGAASLPPNTHWGARAAARQVASHRKLAHSVRPHGHVKRQLTPLPLSNPPTVLAPLHQSLSQRASVQAVPCCSNTTIALLQNTIGLPPARDPTALFTQTLRSPHTHTPFGHDTLSTATSHVPAQPSPALRPPTPSTHMIQTAKSSHTSPQLLSCKHQ